MTNQEKIDAIVRHKDNVLKNAIFMGENLMKLGGQWESMGVMLIANGYIHDYSKFFGIEFEQLFSGNTDKDKMSMAISQHNK